MSNKSVFIAVPHYGQLVPEAVLSLVLPTAEHRCKIQTSCASLLGLNFNRLWCAALNQRDARGLTHFAMHHADISSKELWLDLMLVEMDRVNADILSTVVPLKDNRGLTSTAVLHHESGDIQRLTMTDVFKLPVTFRAETINALMPEIKGNILLVNTGLWVCRFTDQWIEEFPGFHIEDGINRHSDGTFHCSAFSEDWNFSRWAHHKGLKVFATRIIPATHFGGTTFRNDSVWGEWTTDYGDGPDAEAKRKAAQGN